MNIIVVVILIAAVAAGVYFFVIKKKGSSGSTTSGTVLPTGWSITNSKPYDGPLSQYPSGGNYYFDFPTSPTGIHYVVEPAPKLDMGSVVKLEFNVSGSGTVVPVQGDKATVSLFMQRRGDNLSGSGPYQQYRYWHSGAPLTNGDGSLSCTLTPDQWGDVFGSNGMEHQTEFAACVANCEMIGFTFGDPGAGATGHGAYSNGSNRFTLKSFTIT